MQRMFPSDDATLQSWAADELAQADSAGLHLFDMFMRSSGLSENLTVDQLEDRAARLQRIELFSAVDLADLENLSRGINVIDYADGTQLFEQGSEGDAMYLVDRGNLAIFTVDAQGSERPLRVFEPGSVVGELAVLDGQPRSARARASGPLTALVLRRDMFRMYVQSRPQVILAVMRALSEKGRYTTGQVEKAVQQVGSIARGHYSEAASLAAESAAQAKVQFAPSRSTQIDVTDALADLARTLAQRENTLRDEAQP
jgi:CRP-like cAMP-binding protein